MLKYSYVEDYIEIINGDRDPATGKLYGLFHNTAPIISLARYDVQIVNSMSNATSTNRPLTDRQAELACKIVSKYRKQLEKLAIDVSPVDNPQFRLGVRTIDRRKILSIENDVIVLHFPYDVKLIDDVRELAKLSQGRWLFDGETKTWRLGLTETNAIAANGFAQNHQFEISKEFTEIVSAISICEEIDYAIKLINTPEGLTITNAAPSLTEYINNWCGFDYSNINRLVDVAPILGYTVDQVIEQELVSKYSPRIYNLMTAKEIKFNPTVHDDVAKEIVDYANITNRYPIYVYEPNLSGHLLNGFVNQNFKSDEIYQVTELKKEPITVGKKVIYFHKFSASWTQPIPMLISGQGMMHGGDKSMLLQRAEKVVYFAAEVYNNKTMQQRA
jgi:hypothetical protein